MIPCELQSVIESLRQHGINTQLDITKEIALLYLVYSYEYLLRLLMTLKRTPKCLLQRICINHLALHLLETHI